MSDKCPCINCICVPICRNKLYGYLFRDCALVSEYVVNYLVVRERNVDNMTEIVKVLKPVYWNYEYNHLLNWKYPVVNSMGSQTDLIMQLRMGDKL